MEFSATLRTNTLTNKRYVSAQLVNLKTLSLLDLADELSEEGSSHSQSDIAGVLLLLQNRLGTILAKGYKVDLGAFTLTPTIEGSVTEEAFRASLKKGYIANGDTEAEATQKANAKEFTAAALTSAKVTAGLNITNINGKLMQRYQNLANSAWKRVSAANSAESNQQTTDSEQGTGTDTGGTNPPAGGGGLNDD